MANMFCVSHLCFSHDVLAEQQPQHGLACWENWGEHCCKQPVLSSVIKSARLQNAAGLMRYTCANTSASRGQKVFGVKSLVLTKEGVEWSIKWNFTGLLTGRAVNDWFEAKV